MGKSKSKGFDKGIILIVIIVIIIITTGLFLFFQLRIDKISELIKEGEPVKVLFLLRDDNSLIASELVMYHPRTGKGAVFDIPGDTGVLLTNLNRIDRIDKNYNWEKPEIFLKSVEELMDTGIPYYIQIEADNIVKLVDLLEGFPIFNANPVEISKDQNHILLPSGSFLLDGKKALTFLTYTDEGESDIEVTSRKHKFIQSFIRIVGEKQSYLQEEDIIQFLIKLLETNLSRQSILALFSEYGKIDSDRMVTQRVLGVKRMVENQELLFPHRDGRWLKETVRQTVDSLANTEVVGDADYSVALRILNGTAVSGLASRTSQLFMNFGYDLISVGNAPTNNEEFTVIYTDARNIERAQRVAGIIRCTKVELLDFEEKEELLNEVTIILGKDFDGRYCK